MLNQCSNYSGKYNNKVRPKRLIKMNLFHFPNTGYWNLHFGKPKEETNPLISLYKGGHILLFPFLNVIFGIVSFHFYSLNEIFTEIVYKRDSTPSPEQINFNDNLNIVHKRTVLLYYLIKLRITSHTHISVQTDPL